MSPARLLAGTGGGLAAAVALGLLLAASPWRPSGLPVGLVVVGVLVPAAAAAGTRTALRRAGDPAEVARHAGRLAGVGAPVLVLLVLFSANAALGLTGLAAQQLAALVVGTTAAAALATRFSDPALAEEG